tara:strand:+ start:2490 stop:3626 length:1137 start_codon:yes stop_codon:yes gene_type:complete
MNENWFKEKSLWSRFKNAYLKDANFKKYWKNLKIKNIDKELAEILDFYTNSKSYDSSSRFWHILNIRNINQINELGIKNFASTVALNYFTFTDFNDERIGNVVSELDGGNHEVSNYDIFKKYKNLNYTQSINHNIILNLLYSYYKKYYDINSLSVYKDKDYLIEETPHINIEGQIITQDRINSALEYHTIKKVIDIYQNKINLLEIGAGSGRTTETILAFEKNKISKYFVVDLPPALYLNFIRLKTNFPDKKIGVANNINTEDEIKEFISNHDVVFLLPHQLDLLKKNNINIQIFLAIDCLHEMDKKSIKYYMNYANELAEYFYFKIWNETHVPYAFNNYLSASDENSYHINPNWIKEFKNECIFPANYFDFCFKIKN